MLKSSIGARSNIQRPRPLVVILQPIGHNTPQLIYPWKASRAIFPPPNKGKRESLVNSQQKRRPKFTVAASFYDRKSGKRSPDDALNKAKCPGTKTRDCGHERAVETNLGYQDTRDFCAISDGISNIAVFSNFPSCWKELWP